jgi:hypothetical protein
MGDVSSAGARLCACGCGEPTPIARKTDRRWRNIAGQPTEFRRGHGARGAAAHRRAADAAARAGARSPAMTRRLNKRITRGPGDHWTWTGAKTRNHRPLFHTPDGWQPADRIAYALYIAPTDASVRLKKLCRQPGCINPWHRQPLHTQLHTTPRA